MLPLVFDQSSPVHPVSESRGSPERYGGGRRTEILVSNIGFEFFLPSCQDPSFPAVRINPSVVITLSSELWTRHINSLYQNVDDDQYYKHFSDDVFPDLYTAYGSTSSCVLIKDFTFPPGPVS